MNWCEAFAAYIRKLGLTQQDVAFQLKKSPSFIHYWIKDVRPRDEKVRKRIERWSGGVVSADLPAPARAA